MTAAPAPTCSASMLPAPEGTCPLCAVAHDDDKPHNQQSVFYQMRFNGTHGRAPTWADAIAHCPPDVREHWRSSIYQMDPTAWSEPEGDPIAEPVTAADGNRRQPIPLPACQPNTVKLMEPDPCEADDPDDQVSEAQMLSHLDFAYDDHGPMAQLQIAPAELTRVVVAALGACDDDDQHEQTRAAVVRLARTVRGQLEQNFPTLAEHVGDLADGVVERYPIPDED